VAFHDALFRAGRPTRERLIGAIRAARLNERRTAADLSSRELRAELQRNQQLGRALGLTGTPAYVVGDRILNGAVGPEELRAAIAEARGQRG
jgi:protein-disulfide isomerase